MLKNIGIYGIIIISSLSLWNCGPKPLPEVSTPKETAYFKVIHAGDANADVYLYYFNRLTLLQDTMHYGEGIPSDQYIRTLETVPKDEYGYTDWQIWFTRVGRDTTQALAMKKNIRFEPGKYYSFFFFTKDNAPEILQLDDSHQFPDSVTGFVRLVNLTSGVKNITLTATDTANSFQQVIDAPAYSYSYPINILPGKYKVTYDSTSTFIDLYALRFYSIVVTNKGLFLSK